MKEVKNLPSGALMRWRASTITRANCMSSARMELLGIRSGMLHSGKLGYSITRWQTASFSEARGQTRGGTFGRHGDLARENHNLIETLLEEFAETTQRIDRLEGRLREWVVVA